LKKQQLDSPVIVFCKPISGSGPKTRKRHAGKDLPYLVDTAVPTCSCGCCPKVESF